MVAKCSSRLGQKVKDAIPEELREGIIVQLGISQDPPANLKNTAEGTANNNSGRVGISRNPAVPGCDKVVLAQGDVPKALGTSPNDGVVAVI